MRDLPLGFADKQPRIQAAVIGAVTTDHFNAQQHVYARGAKNGGPVAVSP